MLMLSYRYYKTNGLAALCREECLSIIFREVGSAKAIASEIH